MLLCWSRLAKSNYEARAYHTEKLTISTFGLSFPSAFLALVLAIAFLASALALAAVLMLVRASIPAVVCRVP